MISRSDGCTNRGAERSFIWEINVGDGHSAALPTARPAFRSPCGCWQDIKVCFVADGTYGRSTGPSPDTKKREGINNSFKLMVNSMPEWKAAVFTHGKPIVANMEEATTMSVKDQLLYC